MIDKDEMRGINDKFEIIINELSQQRVMMSLLGVKLDAHVTTTDAKLGAFEARMGAFEAKIEGILTVNHADTNQVLGSITSILARHDDRLSALEAKKHGG